MCCTLYCCRDFCKRKSNTDNACKTQETRKAIFIALQLNTIPERSIAAGRVKPVTDGCCIAKARRRGGMRQWHAHFAHAVRGWIDTPVGWLSPQLLAAIFINSLHFLMRGTWFCPIGAERMEWPQSHCFNARLLPSWEYHRAVWRYFHHAA